MRADVGENRTGARGRHRRLGVAAGVVAVVLVLIVLLASLASVAAGVRPLSGERLALEVQALLAREGLDAVREYEPFPPVDQMPATRVVVVDPTGLVVAGWPEREVVGRRIRFAESAADLLGRLRLRVADLRSRIGIAGSPPVLNGGRGLTDVPFPLVSEWRDGKFVRTETGRILYGDAPWGRSAAVALRRYRAVTPDGQTYYVFAATAPWVFLGLADTQWNVLLEQVALALYAALAVLLAWWVAQDARAHEVRPWSGWALMTLVSGPAGWLAYRLARSKALLCPQCGAPVRSDYAGCPRCGLQLRPLCAGCGAPVSPEWLYCAHCTRPLHA